MTFATGKRSGSAGRAGARRPGGFTLLELVLTLAILGTLAGVTVLNFGGFARGRRLDEAVRRLETAVRLARAESANEGRRLRFEPDDETGRLRLLWEPEPLRRPGEFEHYACTWRKYLPGDSVRVVGCRLTGESSYRTLWSEQFQEDAYGDVLEPVTFYPDGTSDSAAVELAGEDAHAVVEINGPAGTVSSRTLPPDEWGLNE